MAVIQHFGANQMKELKEFLYEAQRLGYGGENLRGAKVIELKNAPVLDIGGGSQTETHYECGLIERIRNDGASELLYCSPDERFVYIDKWYGGEPFAGMTTVTYNGVACFAMTYWGKLFEDVDKEEIYTFLKAALQKIDPEYPWRGPDEYVDPNQQDAKTELCYKNQWSGDSGAKFSGEETIYLWRSECNGWRKFGRKIYEMHYHGGLVNMW